MRNKALNMTLLMSFLSLTMPTQAHGADDWTSLLGDPRFLPAIKNCLALHPKGQGPAVVMNLWHANLEEAGVMTTDLSGRRYQCVAYKDTGADSRSHTVFDLPGPLFVSIDQAKTPPQGKCIVSTPVIVDEKLQGWILRQPLLDPHMPSVCSVPIWNGLEEAH